MARNVGISESLPNLFAEAVADAVTVTVVAIGPPFGVTVAGEKLQEIPAGNPEQLNETTELKPFTGVNEREKEPLCPALMVSEEDDAVKEKSAEARFIVYWAVATALVA